MFDETNLAERDGAVGKGLAERRLTRRVHKSWRTKAGARLPSWADIRALDLGTDWAGCFAVDLALTHDLPYFIYVGDALSELATTHLAGDRDANRSLVELAAAKIDEAALSRSPVEYSDTLRLASGERIAFRSVLLPLSDNGEDVTHIFGAASGRGL